MRNANEEFWMVAGARAIAKAPRSLIKSTLRHVISKNLMARAIIEVDRSNLKLVKKIEPYFEIRHYEPLDMQLYGIDDQ